MLLLIGFVFAIAVLGAVLAVYELRGRKLPWPVALLHGGAALAAIALLVVLDVHAPGNLLINSATAVFVLAAIGGSLLFLLRLRHETAPGFMVALHAGFALTAILLLTLGYVNR
jgi:hypothetical protein